MSHALYLYVTIQDEDRLSIWHLDPETGALSLHEDLSLPGGPAPIAVDPTQRRMYVGLRATCQLASLAIDPVSGRLERIGTIPLESDPC